MRKIDKSEIIATEYFLWSKQLETSQTNFKYNSSKNEFYLDVLINLIILQNGLCAYTEFRLVEEDKIVDLKNLFVNGRYAGSKPESSFEIEHFDSNLAKTKGWKWENLFAVYDSINTKVKKRQDVKHILKPDSIEYDPLEFLDYDEDLHIFIPSEKLNIHQRKEVKKMILVLGLNWGQIKMKRSEFISEQFFKSKHNQPINIHQFITAYEMYISKK